MLLRKIFYLKITKIVYFPLKKNKNYYAQFNTLSDELGWHMEAHVVSRFQIYKLER